MPRGRIFIDTIKGKWYLKFSDNHNQAIRYKLYQIIEINSKTKSLSSKEGLVALTLPDKN